MTDTLGNALESARMTRIVVLGGGIGGLTATRQLEREFRNRGDIEITLVSRDNFFQLSPLLFEACSGVLELRHSAQPTRPTLHQARFVEASVRDIDVERKIVHATAPRRDYEIPYDHVVIALGATTNMSIIPGSHFARTFKTAADALLLRNHLIERFERADVEADPRRRQQLLTVVVIGGGLVGVELLGELTAFADDVLRYYPRIRRDEMRFHLFEVGDRLLRESTPWLGEYAARILSARGAQLHTSTPVQEIEPARVHVRDAVIEADTIVLAAGIVPSAVAAATKVERDKRGRIVADAMMQSVSHPGVWAIGDCASIPGPDGQPYPALAQNALRQARAVARNIHAVVMRQRPKPFVHRSLGTMAAFGHTEAAAEVRGLHFTGFLAWWMRRTYYLFQMPLWDRRLRIALDWTISLFFKPDLTKVDLAEEYQREQRNCPAGALLDHAPTDEHTPEVEPERVLVG